MSSADPISVLALGVTIFMGVILWVYVSGGDISGIVNVAKPIIVGILMLSLGVFALSFLQE